MANVESPADIERLTPHHIAKVRCVNEMKVIAFDESIITQAVINKIRFKAEQHRRLHPTHQLEITIYDKAPETMDID